MRKYSDNPQDADGHNHGSGHLDVQMQTHMRLFRAQRNFYISGFAHCVLLSDHFVNHCVLQSAHWYTEVFIQNWVTAHPV